MLPGLEHCYLHDNLITGTTNEEHHQYLDMVLAQLKEHGVDLWLTIWVAIAMHKASILPHAKCLVSLRPQLPGM